MKRLVVVLALLLNGCALYDAYTMAHYDGDEYGQIVDIRVTAHEGAAKCGNPANAIDTAKDLAKKTLAFQCLMLVFYLCRLLLKNFCTW